MEIKYKEYLDLLKNIKESNSKPRLLLHGCCAPCSSEVLNELCEYFDITIYYCNSNIYPKEEFELRYNQFKKLPNSFDIIKAEYNPDDFYSAIKGYEKDGEFSYRCYKCMEERIRKAALKAKEKGYDYFSTTLSISPYKKSDWINEIGFNLERECGVKYLYSNFKKNDGYKKTIGLSKDYGLYRQEYCGCIYSLEESQSKKVKDSSIN